MWAFFFLKFVEGFEIKQFIHGKGRTENSLRNTKLRCYFSPAFIARNDFVLVEASKQLSHVFSPCKLIGGPTVESHAALSTKPQLSLILVESHLRVLATTTLLVP
jgi:hypothetical protein